MEPLPQRLREAESIRIRDAALRVVLTCTDAFGNGLLGVKDLVTAEATSHEFALSDGRFGMRSYVFQPQVAALDLRTSAEICERLVAALGGSDDAGASAFAAARASRAPERACVAIAALRGCTENLISAGAIEALVTMVSRAVADRARARASLGLVAIATMLFVHGPHGSNSKDLEPSARVSDAFMDAGLIEVAGVVTATRGPEDFYLRESCFFALVNVQWNSPKSLPRVSHDLIENLVGLLGESLHGEMFYLLCEIARAHVNGEKGDDAPRVSCADGVIGAFVSPQSLSIIAGFINDGFGNDSCRILNTLLSKEFMGPYARAIGACDEVMEALFAVIALDRAGEREYTAPSIDPDVPETTFSGNYDQPGGFEGTPDARCSALETMRRMSDHKQVFGDGARERLRPLVPLLTKLLIETQSAAYGPDTFGLRSYSCILIGTLCGSTYGLSRELVDANALDALIGVLERARLPESTATPMCIGVIQQDACSAICALMATGQLEAARRAIAASTVVQPDAEAFEGESGLFQHYLRGFSDATPTEWDEHWLQTSWVQSVIRGINQ